MERNWMTTSQATQIKYLNIKPMYDSQDYQHINHKKRITL